MCRDGVGKISNFGHHMCPKKFFINPLALTGKNSKLDGTKKPGIVLSGDCEPSSISDGGDGQPTYRLLPKSPLGAKNYF